MKSWQETREKIREIHVADKRKKILLVEGEEDVNSYKNFFFKNMVVDKDEWTLEYLRRKQERLPKLIGLPRYCMESYLVQPLELWDALPPRQQERIGGFEVLESAILTDLEKWVRHGVLWSIMNPMGEELRSLGFVDDLLSFQVAQEDEAILAKLQEWHEFLEPINKMGQFREKLEEVKRLPIDEQLSHWVHGKQFWRQHVHVQLNRLTRQSSEKERREDLFLGLKLPQDWNPIWTALERSI